MGSNPRGGVGTGEGGVTRFLGGHAVMYVQEQFIILQYELNRMLQDGCRSCCNMCTRTVHNISIRTEPYVAGWMVTWIA